jgi:hypothetical protein
MLPQAAIAAVLDTVRGFHIAAEVAAVDFGLAALAADIYAPHFGSHRFAHFVREHESRHVVRAEIARQRQHALALDLIAEDRNSEKVSSEQRRKGNSPNARRMGNHNQEARCLQADSDTRKSMLAAHARRKSGSHMTQRWRKTDSNPRSHLRRQHFFETAPNPATTNRPGSQRRF